MNELKIIKITKRQNESRFLTWGGSEFMVARRAEGTVRWMEVEDLSVREGVANGVTGNSRELDPEQLGQRFYPQQTPHKYGTNATTE